MVYYILFWLSMLMVWICFGLSLNPKFPYVKYLNYLRATIAFMILGLIMMAFSLYLMISSGV